MRLNRIFAGILASLTLFGMAGCGVKQPTDTTPIPSENKTIDYIEPYAFVSDANVKFALQDASFTKVYAKSELDESSGNIVVVDLESQNQTVDGFGASFTDTATYLFSLMSEETRNSVMTKLFDEEKGIGLDMIRNPLGACDFSLEYYTYNDIPEGETDYELERFDFSKAAGQIELTKQAMEINPDIKLFLAPWTAPLWMKTHYEFNTAKAMTKLRRDCYNVYADYLVKCIQGYEEQGVPVYAFSVQNEPLIVTDWPSMYWTCDELASFVIDRMVPALEEAGLETKLLNLDHNWQRMEDGGWDLMAATAGVADGMAFHWYAGDPEIMEEVAEKFPNAEIYVTEASYNRPADIGCMLEVTSMCARSLRSGAQGYLMWNMAISTIGGPALNENTWNSGLISVDMDTGEASFTGDYYSMAHFSKFIHQGAMVLDSTDTGIDSNYKLVNLVTRNPNGTMTAVVVNYTNNAETMKFVLGDQVMEVTVAGRNIVTLTWDAN